MKIQTEKRNCLNCTEEFDAPVRDLKRNRAKFCSLKCSGIYNTAKFYKSKNLPNVNCSYCNKIFYRNETDKLNSRSGLYFCNRKHKDLAQRLNGIKEIHPSHYSSITGRDPAIKKYRNMAFKNLPVKCKNCGYSKYKSVLQVHHIDKNNTNNKIENLEILCPTCHNEKHYLTKSGLYNKMK